MMNLEDKIIAYLDGTLDETSRAELLHTLSVSPEKRKLLEEHIKLREIISLGHKPASVPLMTERKLADRIPLLLQELPYLTERSNRVAAPIVGTSTSYFTLLGRQVSSFFTSRVGQAVSLGTLALLGGMSWYMSRSNVEEQVQAPQTSIVQSQRAERSNTTPSPFTADRSGNVTTAPQANTHADALGTDGVSGSNTAQSSSRVSVKHNKLSSAIKRGAIAERQTFANKASSASKHDGSNANVSSNHTSNSSDQANNVKSNDPAKETASKSSTDNSVNNEKQKPQSVEPSKSIADPKDLPPLPLPSKERNVTGRWTLQADYSTSVSVRPNVEQQQYETTTGIGAPVLGIGYEIDPHFAVGIEGGKSSLFQQQQTVDKPRGAQGPANSPISVNDRVTYTTGVNDVNAYWTQATFRYSKLLINDVNFELSAGAGAAFVDGVSPMVSLGGAITYDLSETWALTGGVTGRGAWLSGLNAEDPSVGTTGGGHATAVVSHRPSTSDLFSSSIAGRVGIRFRFF